MTEEEVYFEQSIKLYEALTSGKGLQAILTAAGEILNNPILIADLNFKLIAHTEPPGIDNSLWRQIIDSGQYPDTYIRAITNDVDLYNKVYGSGEPKILHDATGPEQYMSKMISVNGKPVGFSTCLEYSSKITPLDTRLFDVFCAVVGSELRSDETIREYNARQIDYFISELLSGPAKADFISERIKGTGLNLKSYLSVLVAEFKDEKMRREYQLEYFRAAFDRVAPLGLCIIYRNSLVMLFSHDQKEIFTHKLLDNISVQLETADMLGGISYRFRQIEDLNIYYKQARAAIRIGRRLRGETRLFEYRDTVFYHMLDIVRQSDDLKRFCDPRLLDAIEYDAENKTSFSMTAYVFLHANRNPALAAKQLDLHRNTIDYRINRLEELFGMDFDDSETVFLLEQSYRILRFMAMPPFASEKED